MTDRHILTNERDEFLEWVRKTHSGFSQSGGKINLDEHRVRGLFAEVRDADVNVRQLRGNLSLAEEGLANAMQEIEALKHDNARLVASLTAEVNVNEPCEQLCDGATPVRASTAEVVLPNTAESTASPVHPSQGYCGNWPCRLPNYHTGPCNSSPSQRT